MPKFLLMAGSIVLSVYAAICWGRCSSRSLFYGDFKAWTAGNHRHRHAVHVPDPAALVVPGGVACLFSRFAGHLYRAYVADRERSIAGRMDLMRWLALLLAAMLLSFLVASLLTLLGYDPRGGFVDSYQQRNALVVGFVMAFAVIPNIYTLAEDALSSVPGHLRAAAWPAAPRPGRRRCGSSCRRRPRASSLR
jgi:phosphate transport system permease protein